MARGKGKRKTQGTKWDQKSKKHGKKKKSASNGRDIKHRDQFKRRHSDPTDDKTAKRQKIEDPPVDDESEEEVDAYKQFLATFCQKNANSNAAVESEDEDEDGDEDGDEDDDESDVSFSQTVDELQPSLIVSEPHSGGKADNDENTGANMEEIDDDDHVDNGAPHGASSDDDSSANQIDEDEDDDCLDLKAQEDVTSREDDPFVIHICRDLSDDAVEFLSQPKPTIKVEELMWKTLGRVVVTIPQIPSNAALTKALLEEPKTYAQASKAPTKLNLLDLKQLHVKTQLHDTLAKVNCDNVEVRDAQESLTPLQQELFTLMNNYQDLYYTERTLKNGEEVRLAYCLHAANHVIKTRNTVLHHNARLNKKQSVGVPEDFRDQGLVRPKVLILVPFREQARRVVEMLIKLFVRDDGKGSVMNRKRFEEEFTGDELVMPKKNPRPEDYETLFSGNTDDTFRLGLTLTKKCVKLYADFYSADIIVASPLGLRMIVGAEGEAERDYDFLASIEIVILDQAEIFLMQNWDHLLHVWNHFHLQPRESHGTDFSRVRQWAVNGWAKHYRQTILLSSVALIEFSSLLNKRCANYAGSIRIVNPIASGTICQVVVQLPQVFQRLEAATVSQSLDVRFDFLTHKVLPDHTDPIMAHTLIYVPSYFDFVRIRNYLRKQGLSFVQICEYSKEGKIARARDMFYHSQVQFLLYSERFHFFRRPLIKGIRHIIFYQPPTIPHFYSEICNQMQEANQNPYGGSENNMTVTVLYNKFDTPQLSAIVGTERASRMIASDRNVHMFMAGE